jgi:hypothetical protein
MLIADGSQESGHFTGKLERFFLHYPCYSSVQQGFNIDSTVAFEFDFSNGRARPLGAPRL